MKVLVIKWTINEYVLLIIRMFSHGFQSSLLGERVVSVQATAMEVSKWAFAGYGLRWKIEEYHRHIKLEYALEAIQIKTFTGIQPMSAILTVAKYMIYRKIKSIHLDLLLDTGYNIIGIVFFSFILLNAVLS